MVQSKVVEMVLAGTPLPKPDCPKCGEGFITHRKGKTGYEFLGCSRYPNCDWNDLPLAEWESWMEECGIDPYDFCD
jgi:ssDNA-binding Zn-finger/Zn-ribbon topoisomerase 1